MNIVAIIATSDIIVVMNIMQIIERYPWERENNIPIYVVVFRDEDMHISLYQRRNILVTLMSCSDGLRRGEPLQVVFIHPLKEPVGQNERQGQNLHASLLKGSIKQGDKGHSRSSMRWL